MLRISFKSLLLFYLSNITNIEGTANEIVTKYVSGRDVYSSYETVRELSKFKCVDRCLRDFPSRKCKAAGYSKATKHCRLSSNSEVTIRANDSSAGVYLLTFTGTCVLVICSLLFTIITIATYVPVCLTHFNSSFYVCKYTLKWNEGFLFLLKMGLCLIKLTYFVNFILRCL